MYKLDKFITHMISIFIIYKDRSSSYLRRISLSHIHIYTYKIRRKSQNNSPVGQNLWEKAEFIFTRNKIEQKNMREGGTRATLIGALIVPDAISSQSNTYDDKSGRGEIIITPQDTRRSSYYLFPADLSGLIPPRLPAEK